MSLFGKMQESSLSENQEMLERVVSYLKKHGERGFPILFNYPLKIQERIIRSDIFLPEGCLPIGYDGPTVIELKSRLGADTIYRYYDLFLNGLKGEIRNFILIYNDKNEFSNSLLRKFYVYKKKGFHIYTISGFCKGEAKQNKQQPWQEIIPRLEPIDEKRKWQLIEEAHEAFVSGRNSLFLGAGVSCSAHVPDWDSFLKGLLDKDHFKSINNADYPSIKDSCDYSSIISGRYIKNGFVSEDEFKKEMHRELYKNRPKPNSELFKELVRFICCKKSDNCFYVDQAVTFNYDDLLETALENNRPYRSIFNRTIHTDNDIPIYHVHGMIPQNRKIDSTPILAEQEYHQLYKESYHWSNVVQLYALGRSTCFFVGLSMNDPNLRRLLDISMNGAGTNEGVESIEPMHFAIMERKPLDKDNPDLNKDIEHAINMEKMMYQLGINIIWYNNSDGKHQEVPEILRAIRLG